MSIEGILAEIDSEIARLQQAKQLLGATITKKGPGRPPGQAAAALTAPKVRRTLSASARAKIGAAQKARWAKVRKAAGKNGASK